MNSLAGKCTTQEAAPSNTRMKKTCDRCVSQKVKCDGLFPVCTNCSKSRSLTVCKYSVQKKRGPNTRKQATESRPHLKNPVMNLSLCSVISHPNHQLFNSRYLYRSVRSIGKQFPIINDQELLEGIDFLHHPVLSDFDFEDVYAFDHKCACRVILWSCVAIGAFLEGDKENAEKLCTQAVEASFGYSISLLPSIIRAELLMTLIHIFTRKSDCANRNLQNAETGGSFFPELRGVIKALKIFILPAEQGYNSTEQNEFNDNELQNFSLDSKIYHKWHLSFLRNAVFQSDPWVYASDCYTSMLIAEEHTIIFGIMENSPQNWLRLQPILLRLELFHLSLPMKGLQRARDLTEFLIKNEEFIDAIKHVMRVRESVWSLLQALGSLFQKLHDIAYLEMVQQLCSVLQIPDEVANCLRSKRVSSSIIASFSDLVESVAAPVSVGMLVEDESLTRTMENLLCGPIIHVDGQDLSLEWRT